MFLQRALLVPLLSNSPFPVRRVAAIVFAVAAAPAAYATTYVVGTATPLPAGALRVSSLAAVPWQQLAAGSQVLVSPGTYGGVTTIIASGTQAAPIVVAPFTAGQSPLLTNTIDIQSSAWIRISGLTLSKTTYSGVIIRNGSNHITLTGNTIENAPVGISITSGAGTGNQILNNIVSASTQHGIAVDVNASPTDRTVISGNTITNSGTHGMEIHASHYQIEHNIVSGSGLITAGSSGIHLYAASATEDAGDDNLVRYNATYGTHDATAYDGNGIEADHWCDNNTIAFNVAWDNDGAGINVYDAQYNLVESNTVYGNERDPGGTHAASGGEIVINDSGLKRSAHNVVRDNIVVSTHSVTPAFHLDSGGLGNANVVGPNIYYNTTAGKLVRYGDSNLSQTLAQINAISGTTGSLVGLPAFTNVSAPLSNGLRLAAMPSGTGLYLSGTVDRLGQAAISGWSFFGAYFTHP